MAHTVVITNKLIDGNRRFNYGTFTASGSTSDTFTTGLRKIECIKFEKLGSTDTSFADNVVNTGVAQVTFSGSGTTGCWLAIGY